MSSPPFEPCCSSQLRLMLTSPTSASDSNCLLFSYKMFPVVSFSAFVYNFAVIPFTTHNQLAKLSNSPAKHIFTGFYFDNFRSGVLPHLGTSLYIFGPRCG